jgi:hypothetical protein
MGRWEGYVTPGLKKGVFINISFSADSMTDEKPNDKTRSVRAHLIEMGQESVVDVVLGTPISRLAFRNPPIRRLAFPGFNHSDPQKHFSAIEGP